MYVHVHVYVDDVHVDDPRSGGGGGGGGGGVGGK